MGQTCVVIKPEAIERNDEIKEKMRENKFFTFKTTGRIPYIQELCNELHSPKRLQYPIQLANELMPKYIWYDILSNYSKPEIEALLVYSMPLTTIQDFKKFVGPGDPLEYMLPENKHTLRAKYGLSDRHVFTTFIKGYECRFAYNGIHASSSEDEFREDMKIFFPEDNIIF